MEMKQNPTKKIVELCNGQPNRVCRFRIDCAWHRARENSLSTAFD